MPQKIRCNNMQHDLRNWCVIQTPFGETSSINLCMEGFSGETCGGIYKGLSVSMYSIWPL